MTEQFNRDLGIAIPESAIKRKIVSFRVSDDEFQVVDETCRKLGFSSVATFARSATLMCNSSDPVRSPVDMEFDRLWRRIDVLTTTLEELTAHLTMALGLLKAA